MCSSSPITKVQNQLIVLVSGHTYYVSHIIILSCLSVFMFEWIGSLGFCHVHRVMHMNLVCSVVYCLPSIAPPNNRMHPSSESTVFLSVIFTCLHFEIGFFHQRYLLDQLEMEFGATPFKDSMASVFGGVLTNVIVCKNCGYQSRRQVLSLIELYSIFSFTLSCLFIRNTLRTFLCPLTRREIILPCAP